MVALVVKNPPANEGDIRDTRSISGLGRCPGKGNGNPLQHSWPGESHAQRGLTGYSPRGCKESDTTKATWHIVQHNNVFLEMKQID